MNDAGLVSGREGLGDTATETDRIVHTKGPLRQLRGKVVAIEPLHDEVHPTAIGDAVVDVFDDGVMTQRGDGLGFAHEPFSSGQIVRICVEHLDRDRSSQWAVVAAMNDTHTSLPDASAELDPPDAARRYSVVDDTTDRRKGLCRFIAHLPRIRHMRSLKTPTGVKLQTPSWVRVLEARRGWIGGNVAKLTGYPQATRVCLVPARTSSVVFFTIGYEGHALDDFIATLLEAGVQRIVDVRELPLSRKRGFSKRALAEALAEHGIEYVHVRAAGNPFRDLRHDIDRCLAAYREHLRANPAVLDEVMAALEGTRAALLCVEHDYAMCHRSVLAARLARRKNVKVAAHL